MTISMERVGDLIQNVGESIKKIDFSLASRNHFDEHIDFGYRTIRGILTTEAMIKKCGQDNGFVS